VLGFKHGALTKRDRPNNSDKGKPLSPYDLPSEALKAKINRAASLEAAMRQ
jgi:hypothetical protein